MTKTAVTSVPNITITSPLTFLFIIHPVPPITPGEFIVIILTESKLNTAITGNDKTPFYVS